MRNVRVSLYPSHGAMMNATSVFAGGCPRGAKFNRARNRLQPGALGLMASVGCAQPLVTRLSRVLHLVTGNEIVPPEATHNAGRSATRIRPLVRAFTDQWRIQPTQIARAGR